MPPSVLSSSSPPSFASPPPLHDPPVQYVCISILFYSTYSIPRLSLPYSSLLSLCPRQRSNRVTVCLRSRCSFVQTSMLFFLPVDFLPFFFFGLSEIELEAVSTSG